MERRKEHRRASSRVSEIPAYPTWTVSMPTGHHRSHGCDFPSLFKFLQTLRMSDITQMFRLTIYNSIGLPFRLGRAPRLKRRFVSMISVRNATTPILIMGLLNSDSGGRRRPATTCMALWLALIGSIEARDDGIYAVATAGKTSTWGIDGCEGDRTVSECAHVR